MMTSEVLPNTVPALLVLATLNAASAILTEASLSFVGLGIQPPDASWGTLLFQGYQKIYQTLWYPLFPGLGDLRRDLAADAPGRPITGRARPA